MISAVLFIDQQGEIVISRFYRDNVARQAADAFRLQVIAGKNASDSPPITIFDRTSFMHIRKGDIYIVAVSKSNSNAGMVFEYLGQLVVVLEAYFGTGLNEASIRENFVLIYELLDETMDWGYPQLLSVDILTKFIKVNSKVPLFGRKSSFGKHEATLSNQITKEITGLVDWREEGKFKYRKNEVYIDVLEEVNVLKSTTGEIIRNDVSGKIQMKTYLSGMPECQFALNDKLVMDKEKLRKGKPVSSKGSSGIAIEDARFHRCINLGMFDAERMVSFVPPDGEFELMSYRVTQSVTPPFSITHVVQQVGRSRVDYEIKVKGNFDFNIFATNVVIKIPTPENTAKYKITAKAGKTKYDPTENAIVWR